MRKWLSMTAVAALVALSAFGVQQAIGASGTLLSTQTSDAVAITGGTIDGVTMGSTTAAPAIAIQQLVASNASASNLTATSTITGASLVSTGPISGTGLSITGNGTFSGLTATGATALSALTSTSLASAGGAAPALRPMGVIFTTNARASTTTGTGAQDLATYSLPANVLNRTGARLRIRGYFSTAANGNNKTIACSFGSSAITSAATAANAKQGWCQLDVVRTGASTQIVSGAMQLDTTMVTPTFANGSETDTATIAIKATCTDGTSSAGDCILNDFFVEVMN